MGGKKLDLKITISKYLKELGVPASLLGYEYLQEAIELVISDKSYIKAICTRLYSTIAKKHDRTIGSVERGIRRAKEISMVRGNWELINKMFGYSIDADKGVPTNKEYIATIADYIKMKEVCGQ
jgi:two-component system response regulator (stage 0 sporulation protein A)